MANIQVFEYQNNKVRTVDVDGEAWFVLKDVCAVLGISNNRMAADRLDDDEKGVSLIDTLGGKQEMVIVNESGLYHVILRSDKPEAAPFRRWVTNDVLPAIRKTGSYNAPQLTRSQLLATALIAAHEELEEKDKQIETMKPKALFADAVSASSQCPLYAWNRVSNLFGRMRRRNPEKPKRGSNVWVRLSFVQLPRRSTRLVCHWGQL